MFTKKKMSAILCALIVFMSSFTMNVSAEEFVPDMSIAFEMNDLMYPVEFYKKVDGDTAWFTYDGEKIKVRFLSIDTPETVKEGVDAEPYGQEASDYTMQRLMDASEIYLEFDPESDLTDAYDRYLAWVWVDGSLLEEELVAQGLAKTAYMYGDYKYNDELLEIEQQAKDQGAGLWSD